MARDRSRRLPDVRSTCCKQRAGFVTPRRMPDGTLICSTSCCICAFGLRASSNVQCRLNVLHQSILVDMYEWFFVYPHVSILIDLHGGGFVSQRLHDPVRLLCV